MVNALKLSGNWFWRMGLVVCRFYYLEASLNDSYLERFPILSLIKLKKKEKERNNVYQLFLVWNITVCKNLYYKVPWAVEHMNFKRQESWQLVLIWYYRWWLNCIIYDPFFGPNPKNHSMVIFTCSSCVVLLLSVSVGHPVFVCVGEHISAAYQSIYRTIEVIIWTSPPPLSQKKILDI